VLVKVASAAVVSQLLGLTRDEIIDAVSLAWVDGQSLRTYRHAPNTGSRKSWAAGDATSRAVRLALMVAKGEMGYPSVLTAKTWGFYDVLFKGKPFAFQRPYGSCYGKRCSRFLSCGIPRPPRSNARWRASHSQAGFDDIARITSDARVGDPHHRQERACHPPTAITHPVHGRGAADLRPPHGRRLRGHRRRRFPHRPPEG
jgi:hypothetical protein